MPAKTFNIKIIDKKKEFKISLETDKTRYESLENVMWVITRHHINQNRVDQIEEILVSLLFQVTSHKYRFPEKPPYFNLSAYTQEKKRLKTLAQSADE